MPQTPDFDFDSVWDFHNYDPETEPVAVSAAGAVEALPHLQVVAFQGIDLKVQSH